MLLVELEAKGLGPKDFTKEEWIAIMREHMKSLGQPEESGPVAAPYADYEAYWERNQ